MTFAARARIFTPRRGSRSLLALSCLAALAFAVDCQDPTQVEVIVEALPNYCALPGSHHIQIFAGARGSVDAEGALPVAEDEVCDGKVGQKTFFVKPSGGDGDRFSIKVLAGSGESAPDSCKPSNAYSGCIVARRILGFVANRTLRLKLGLDADCVGADRRCGNYGEGTCVEGGACASAVVSEPERCTGVEGCLAPQPRGDGGIDRATPQIVAGSIHTCLMRSDRSVLCWGDRIGRTAPSVTKLGNPKRVNVNGGTTRSLVAHFSHTCAIGDRDTLCWGDNRSGELGLEADPNLTRTEQPVPVAAEYGPTSPFRSFGLAYSCASIEGTGTCWGSNTNSQLGSPPTTTLTKLPVRPGPGPGIGFEKIVAGAAHACGVLTGRAQCWGENAQGQLGLANRTSTPDPKPFLIPSEPNDVHEPYAGTSQTCVLNRNTGELWCAGANGNGEISETPGDLLSPTRIFPNDPVKDVALGARHICFLFSSGTIRCRGANDFGQLGRLNSLPGDPVVFVPPIDAVGIAAGDNHTCAVTKDGAVYCWGRNDSGQTGQPGTDIGLGPLPVSFTNVDP